MFPSNLTCLSLFQLSNVTMEQYYNQFCGKQKQEITSINDQWQSLKEHRSNKVVGACAESSPGKERPNQ